MGFSGAYRYDIDARDVARPVDEKLPWFAAVVYLALAAFAAYQALPAQREDPLQRRIGNLYVWACEINVGCVLIGTILNPGKVFALPLLAHLVLAPAVVISLVAMVVIFA